MPIASKPKISPAPAVVDNERLERIERLTHFLDNSLKVPGTNYRVGWDAVIGLIPGVGDVATAALSAYLIYEARKMGASKWVITRMLGNLGVDVVAGSIPILGDLFDVAWKSNRRNTRLLKRHLEKPK